jgi:hypothetical protein
MNRRSFLLTVYAATVAAMTMTALDAITPRRWKTEPSATPRNHWDRYDGNACRVELVRRDVNTIHTGIWGWAKGPLIEPARLAGPIFPTVHVQFDGQPQATLAVCVNELAFYQCDDEGNYLDGLEDYGNPWPIEVKR